MKMAENQKTFMLWITEHALQTFSSSAVTFATLDNSIAATDIGTGTFTAGEKITITGAAETGNNATFTVVTAVADKLVVLEAVTAELPTAAVVINEHHYGDYKSNRDFKFLTGTIYTSQACTLYIDQSRDGITTDYIDYFTVSATTRESFRFDVVVSGYARMRILNGSTDQTSVRAILNGRVN
jgi:hypothetical protein